MDLESRIKEVFGKLNRELRTPLKEISESDKVSTAGLDMSNFGVRINPGFVEEIAPKLEGKSEAEKVDKFLRGVMAHEIGHYLVSPHSLKQALVQRAVSMNYPQGMTLQNLFSDVASNLSMVNEHGINEIAEIYCAINSEDAVMRILAHLHKHHTGLEFTDSDILSDEESQALENLKRVNFLPKSLKDLRLNVAYFCTILKPFVEDESNSDGTDNSNGSNYDKTDNSNESNSDGIDSIDDICSCENVPKEEIEKALKDLLKKRDITPQEFGDLMKSMGVSEGKDPQYALIERYLVEASKYPIKIEAIPLSSEIHTPLFLKEYSVSDPITSINPFASLGQLCTPGLTKRWKGGVYKTYGDELDIPNAVIILDSSGSMQNPVRELSGAVVASFTVAEQYFRNGSKVAAVNFSEETLRTDITTDTYEVYKMLSMYQGGGTTLNLDIIKEIRTPDRLDYILITDTQIENLDETLEYLSEKASNGDRSFVFQIGSGSIPEDKRYRNIKFFSVQRASDLPEIVITSTSNWVR